MGLREGVLSGRNFRLLFAGQCISFLGDGMLRVALPFAVLHLGGSATEIGLVFAAQLLATVSCVLLGGVVADRLSRRAVMVSADLVRVGSQAVLAAFLLSDTAEIWSLALLAATSGAATGFFNPAATGLLPSVVARHELQQANGLQGTAFAAAELAGPAIAGALVASVGAGAAVAIDAATFALSASCLAALRLTPLAARTATRISADLWEGWQIFRSHRWLWATVLWATLTNVLGGAYFVLGPLIADRDLGGPEAWGALLGAAGAGGLIGGAIAIRIRPRRPVVTATLAWMLMATPWLFLGAALPLSVVMIGGLIAGASLIIAESVWESTIQQRIPPGSLSRVKSLDWAFSFGFKPLGFLVWGPLAAVTGPGVALLIAFALMLLTGIGLLSSREIRALRGVQPRPRALDAL